MSVITPPPTTLQEDKVEPSEMVLQLLSSIRNLDGVIDTLMDIVRRDICKDEFKEETKERIDRLLQTRFCLTFSLMDIRPTLAKILEVDEKSILASSSALYESIKRHRSR